MSHSESRRQLHALLVLATAVAVAAPAALAAPSLTGELNQTRGFRMALTPEGVQEHVAALQGISDAHGNRFFGGAGGAASAAYVAERAQAAGLVVSTESFTLTYAGDLTPSTLEQVSPAPTMYVEGVDFRTMRHSGSGAVTATLWAVDILHPVPSPGASTSGCEAADFAGFPAGAIALLQRGTCTFRLKAENAAAAGASAVLIFNDGHPGRTDPIFGTVSPPAVSLPVLGLTSALGDALLATPGATMSLAVDHVSMEVEAWNVVAETPAGDAGNVVLALAQLDGTVYGPAANSRGSGAAALLEIAETLGAGGYETRNKVRFLWHGAYDAGAVGLDLYLAGLGPDAASVRAALVLDALGSPNFVRFVYDGDGGATPGPAGSAEVERILADHFAAAALATDLEELPPAAAPLAALGIPVGGLSTGTAGEKTPAQAATYGGAAGVAYDPCLNLACDTSDNVDSGVLHEMLDAAGHAVLTLGKRNFAMRPLA